MIAHLRRASLVLAGLVLLVGALVVSHDDAVLAQPGLSNAGTYAYWVPPGKCNVSSSGSGAVLGSAGLKTTGASATPVIKAVFSASGAFTETFVCTITPPSATVTTGTGIAIVDATFAYGTENYVTTQSATLASGTMNSSTVFSTITYPTAAAGETASTVTPVRADSGTLTIAPVVGSFNGTTQTAGAFFTMKFTPATPIAWKTANVQLLLTVTINAFAGLETTISSPGVLVHYRSQ